METYKTAEGRIDIVSKSRLSIYGWRTEYRWKAYAKNGELIGISEAYYNKSHCFNNMEVLAGLLLSKFEKASG